MLTALDFKLLLSKDQIDRRLEEIAEQINQEYQGKEITLVMIMKGALCLAADLLRKLTVPCSLEYVQASSYTGKVSGELKLRGLEDIALQNRHVILIDDIFDTGKTLTEIRKELLHQKPASLKTLVLLSKNKVRSTDYAPDYVLFSIEDEFVIGYGLDYKELYRGLPGVYTT